LLRRKSSLRKLRNSAGTSAELSEKREMTEPRDQCPNRALIVHPGTQHAPRLAAELQRRDLLAGFWSGFCFGDDAPWLRFAPPAWRARLGGRVCRGVPDAKIGCRPLLEWQALRRIRRGERGEDVFHERNERFQKSLPKDLFKPSRVVVGFDTSSWILAERSREAGVPFVLEQTVAHPLHKQRMLAEAARRFPGWAEREGGRPDYVLAAERIEHQMAYRIMVGSVYCRNTLVEEGVDPTKIVVNPYGVECAERPTLQPSGAKREGPLRFVFLGFLSLRKGVPLLIEAWQKAGLQDAELVLAGGIREEHRRLLPQGSGVRYEGFVPRRRVPDFLSQQDVYVLPSFSEGFAISLIEGMAAGLPIIASANAGASEAATEGQEGFIVPTGDVDALVDRLRWFATNREKIPVMSAAATKKSEEFTWERYGERYEAMLHELCS
jgi:starch synthase